MWVDQSRRSTNQSRPESSKPKFVGTGQAEPFQTSPGPSSPSDRVALSTKDQIPQGPRVFLRSKATCAPPLREVLTPCRGQRPYHVLRDRIGTWEVSGQVLRDLLDRLAFDRTHCFSSVGSPSRITKTSFESNDSPALHLIFIGGNLVTFEATKAATGRGNLTRSVAPAVTQRSSFDIVRFS